jgi:hypothetical protein
MGCRWDRALARFQRAEAALAAAAQTEDEALYDRLGARHDIALRRLLRTPAPHLAALALKLDLALDERSLEFAGDAAAMKALKDDARRLALSSAPVLPAVDGQLSRSATRGNWER